jgi:hypothetical protein
MSPAFDEASATARCAQALAAAAPRAKVGVFTTQGGRIDSGDWARLNLIKTTSVQFAYLNPLDEKRGVLRLFPGDTLTQARILYADASRIDALLKLKRSGGWDVRPNMHFGYREDGHAWLRPTADLEAYTNYWLAAMPRASELKRNEWSKFMAELFSRDIASDGDQEIFDAAFTSTKRDVASPRPGLWCEKKMDTALDEPARLAEEIRIHLRSILRALYEPLHTID